MKRLAILLALILLSCRPAYATARMVQGTVGTASTGSTSCTVAATVSGNTLIVLFASDGTETVSSITDTNADTFTVVNALYTQGSNQKGGYATAVATASNTTITLTWSGSSNNHYESCAEVNGTASCAAGACVDIAQGLGCATGVACGPTSGQTAAQLDEIVFSGLFTNSAVTANSQVSSDAQSCRTSQSGACSANLWGAGGISTAHVAAYYRPIFQGGTVTCNWTLWTGASISGVSCVGLKSASNSSATFLQGAVAAQTTTTSETCTLPGTTQANAVLVVMFQANNNTEVVDSIADTTSDAFTVVNTIFVNGTTSSGGFATAVSAGGAVETITITWHASGPQHNAACAEIVNTIACANNACVDTGRNGKGCASAQTCGTNAFTAQQNDEIILSHVMTNGAVTINTETSADTGACSSSVPTTGSCAVTRWNSTGSNSTTHGAAYYRNIAAGGSQTCNWTWTTASISGVLCIPIRSGVTFTANACSMNLLGVGCEHEHDAVEEQW